MKTTALLFLLTIYQVSASVYSQNAKLSLRMNDASIEEVFDKIKQNTEFNFLYRSDLFNDAPSVNINVEEANVEEVLDQIVVPNGYTYEIEDKTVVIQKNAPNTAINKQQESQKKSVTGRVTDEKGGPLPGASVIVKGTTIGVVTDIDGNYQLLVPQDAKVLIFSFIGMDTQEIDISNQTSVNVTLTASTIGLKDVVVTALGISREKKSLGYSVGEVNEEELKRVPQQNVLSALSGKVAGLEISNSTNDLNAETRIYIRGRTSIAGEDDPLVVIDGVPFTNPNVLTDINPDNIASVSVLKGPSAAALYGSRAGNGVMIITTKDGKTGDKGLGVSINSSITMSVPYKFIDLQNRFTNGKKGIFDQEDWQFWYGPEEGTMAVQWNTNGEAKPLVFYDNPAKEFFQTGITKINDISVGGNYDKGSFRLSFSNMTGTGNFPGTELKRGDISLSTTYNVTDKLKISANLSMSNPHSDNYPLQSWDDFQYRDIYNIAPHVNINDLRDYWEIEGIQQKNTLSFGGTGSGYGYNNPWFIAYERVFKFNRVRGFGNVKLDWQITPSLSLMGRVTQNRRFEKNERLTPWSSSGMNPQIRPKGDYKLSNTYDQETNSDILLSYNNHNENISFSSSVGGNMMSQNYSYISAGGRDLATPGLYTLSNVAKGTLEYSSAYMQREIYSAYGMLNIGIKDALFIDATARNDWSSTLPENNRSYFYPSASVSLLASEIISMPEWVSMAKFRGGWARVGKDAKPYVINRSLDMFTWGDIVAYRGTDGLANIDLKPEQATSIEAGIDVAFFNNRLGFDITGYTVDNRNQIFNIGIPVMSGYSSKTINVGVIQNKGWEAGLHMTPVARNDLRWDINFNYTKERSRLLELGYGIESHKFWGEAGTDAITYEGEYIGDLYTWDVKRVEEGEYKGWPLLTSTGTLQKGSERVKTGNFTHDFALGGQTSFSYKNLTLSASVDWRQGGNFVSVSMMRMARSGKIEDWKTGISSSTFSGILGANSFGGDAEQLAQEIKNNPGIYGDNGVWIGGRTQDLGGFPMDGGSRYNGAFYPGVYLEGDTYVENFGGPETKYINAHNVIDPGFGYWGFGVDKWVYDASFIKLRDIALSYKLPSPVSRLIRAKGATVSLFSKNILLWTKAKIGFDPEASFYRSGASMDIRAKEGVDRWNGAPWVAPIGFKLNLEF